jgi:EAL and modified HD-GYP domain-containing signal transduction protein
LLARDALSATERDELFVAGMSFLLDVVLSMPMEAVLKQVSQPPLVDEALLYEEGKYAPYLDLAIACEQSDNDHVARLAQAVGLDLWRVSSYHIEAMLWAQQVER